MGIEILLTIPFSLVFHCFFHTTAVILNKLAEFVLIAMRSYHRSNIAALKGFKLVMVLCDKMVKRDPQWKRVKPL